MKVGKDKVVTLTYELHLDDEQGKIIQTVDEKRPFVHLFGIGTLLPAFENNLANLSADDTFGFPLLAADAYGNNAEEAIIELEKGLFEIDGKMDEEMVAVGKILAMQDEQGNPIDGKVLAINDATITMDFNHPLAGKNLYFTGKILDVREASAEELEHKHVHGDGGHDH